MADGDISETFENALLCRCRAAEAVASSVVRSANAPNPVIHLDGFGYLGLPPSASDLDHLLSTKSGIKCELNPLGKAKGQLARISATEFSLENTAWTLFLNRQVVRFKELSGLKESLEVTANLASILVSRPGYSLLENSGPNQTANAFARMHIVLPASFKLQQSTTPHPASSIQSHLTTHNATTTTVISSAWPVRLPTVSITEGSALILVYDLLHTPDSELSGAMDTRPYDALLGAMAAWKTKVSADIRKPIVIGLTQVLDPRFEVSDLVGTDADRTKIAKAMAAEFGLVTGLALLQCETTSRASWNSGAVSAEERESDGQVNNVKLRQLRTLDGRILMREETLQPVLIPQTLRLALGRAHNLREYYPPLRTSITVSTLAAIFIWHPEDEDRLTAPDRLPLPLPAPRPRTVGGPVGKPASSGITGFDSASLCIAACRQHDEARWLRTLEVVTVNLPHGVIVESLQSFDSYEVLDSIEVLIDNQKTPQQRWNLLEDLFEPASSSPRKQTWLSKQWERFLCDADKIPWRVQQHLICIVMEGWSTPFLDKFIARTLENAGSYDALLSIAEVDLRRITANFERKTECFTTVIVAATRVLQDRVQKALRTAADLVTDASRLMQLLARSGSAAMLAALLKVLPGISWNAADSSAWRRKDMLEFLLGCLCQVQLVSAAMDDFPSLSNAICDLTLAVLRFAEHLNEEGALNASRALVLGTHSPLGAELFSKKIFPCLVDPSTRCPPELPIHTLLLLRRTEAISQSDSKGWVMHTVENLLQASIAAFCTPSNAPVHYHAAATLVRCRWLEGIASRDIVTWVIMCIQLGREAMLPDLLSDALPHLRGWDISKVPELLGSIIQALPEKWRPVLLGNETVKIAFRTIMKRFLAEKVGENTPPGVTWKGETYQDAGWCHRIPVQDSGMLCHTLDQLHALSLDGIATWRVYGSDAKVVLVYLTSEYRQYLDWKYIQKTAPLELRKIAPTETELKSVFGEEYNSIVRLLDIYTIHYDFLHDEMDDEPRSAKRRKRQ